MSALRSNGNYAPAYTSMGIYYADIAQDTVRATKCFEKAFELSPGEIEAAERLAHSFAESREWDLVDIIARRVADADKQRSIPGKSMSWPQKAIGVVELVYTFSNHLIDDLLIIVEFTKLHESYPSIPVCFAIYTNRLSFLGRPRRSLCQLR